MNRASRVQTTTPHRVSLPPLDYLTPEVRAAAEKYLGLHGTYHEHVAGVQKSKAAVNAAELADRRSNAETLARGEAVKKPREQQAKAEAKLDDAVAMREAYRSAVGIAYGELRDAVVAAAPGWSAEVAEEHSAAVRRYTEAVLSLETARRDIEATGALLAMLRGSASSLSMPSYRPTALLHEADKAVAEALAEVERHDAAERPVPVDDDTQEVA